MGHIAAAWKRIHQWCFSLTLNNTKTMEEWHVIVSCDQLRVGETFQAAPTQRVQMHTM